MTYSEKHLTHLISQKSFIDEWVGRGYSWMSPPNYTQGILELQHLLDSHIPRNSIRYLLDSGCGTHGFLPIAAEMYVDAEEIIGVDLSPQTVKIANERLRVLGKENVRVIETDIDSFLDSNFGKYSLITSFNSLPDMYDPRRTIERISRALKSGGHIFITAPTDSTIERFKALGTVEYGELPRLTFHLGMSYPYSQYGLRREYVNNALERNGLKVLEDGSNGLPFDVHPMLDIIRHLHLEQEERSKLEDWAKELIDKQNTNPEDNPRVPYYLAQKI